MIRLVPDQSSAIKRSEQVTFYFDGEPMLGHVGESVAVAVQRNGRQRLRQAPNDGAARGMFCCMGLCQECTVRVDGRVVESCRTTVSSGLKVTSLDARS
ncbi:Hydrogen cyanide synthase subunit HcnA [Pseudovibrio axinellae]|uniref:Hydrogen cyanide synthase subunit HcnA n=1 Tax=Pseudovibrio axinellae TaxID=989403 RepID=A0A166BCZ4_9HYPH|nr:(2Fe-2S)-binding protein [Pseudovibrio axinellae]KZL22138.1 Hydrogen cyanide synthase subunit HcnA [Pseudovibrio axinellae]SEQ53767.1 2Fe-2S iron-sulfur cluster binding domain-containing protein [Pseudovibrio axinellae]